MGWHNLKAVITTADGVSTNYAFYVDNQLAERVSNIGGAGTLRSYDNIRIGSGLSNGSTEAYFDNMVLSYDPVVVPEPLTSSLALIACCGLAAIRRRG